MKKIITIILFLVLLGGGYYVWNHRYDYFFQGEMEIAETEQDGSKDSDQKEESENSFVNDESSADKEDSAESDNNSIDLKEKPLEEIIAQDCSQRCENKKGTDDYEYCLEVCGLNEEIKTDDCETFSGIKKDGCYRDKAVAEKNFDYCEKISDDNLKEACRNRVLEEIVDSEKGGIENGE